MTLVEIRKSLYNTMFQYKDYGAADSEGYHVVSDIEHAIERGEPITNWDRFYTADAWQLYYIEGRDQAAHSLGIQLKKYYEALVRSKYDI